MADRLLATLRARHGEVVFDEGALHGYAAGAGTWARIGADEESRIVQGFSGAPLGPPDNEKVLRIDVRDVAGARRLAYDQAARPNFFANAPRGLAFADGFARVGLGKLSLSEHAPANGARVAYPFPHAAVEEAPRFVEFLHEVFARDADADARIDFLAEFFGASLFGIAPRFQRCVCLVGRGNDGKSTALEIVRGAFVTDAVCAIPPQEWGHEYKRALLAGRRLNVVSELPERDILDADAFKAVITGDAMTARAIREAPFTFTPVAGHVFAANALPSVADTSDGFWRRFVVVTFSESFAGREDRFLAARILEEERAGVVGWMMRGARRLIERGDYAIPASSLEAVARWRRAANPVALFLEECTRPLGASEPVGEAAAGLYARYRAWCERSGHRPVTATKFGMRLGELGVSSTRTQRGREYSLRYSGDGMTGLTGNDGNPTCDYTNDSKDIDSA